MASEAYAQSTPALKVVYGERPAKSKKPKHHLSAFTNGFSEGYR